MIRLRAIAPADWPSIEELFGERGACGGCWCMEWRRDLPSSERIAFRGNANRVAFRKLVESGRAHGVLAFDGDTPVAWCSIGPFEAFAALRRKRDAKSLDTAKSWAITCFFIARDYRSRGLGVGLARKAATIAFAHGAKRVHAFPVRVPASGALPAAFAWTGTDSLFHRAGFTRLPHNPRVFIRDRD